MLCKIWSAAWRTASCYASVCVSVFGYVCESAPSRVINVRKYLLSQSSILAECVFRWLCVFVWVCACVFGLVWNLLECSHDTILVNIGQRMLSPILLITWLWFFWIKTDYILMTKPELWPHWTHWLDTCSKTNWIEVPNVQYCFIYNISFSWSNKLLCRQCIEKLNLKNTNNQNFQIESNSRAAHDRGIPFYLCSAVYNIYILSNYARKMALALACLPC